MILKITKFIADRARSLAEGLLTHIGLINKIPKRLKSVLTGNLQEKEIPGILRESLRKCFFLRSAARENILYYLERISPRMDEAIVAVADQICNHVFDLLGSGPTQLGEKIDWHVDFKMGYHWNPKAYYKNIFPARYPGGYDIKVPWELSRCQHFIHLGQAYWITGEERYAHEFVAEVENWIKNNPWPWGVNWVSSMDVSIRAVNWLWGYYFFMDSPNLTDKFLISFFTSMLTHGRHIRHNLENQGGFTNNHYIADLVGLIYLGILCPEFKEATEWREFGLNELWGELFKQVYSDGVSFEASIAYHRLATELFLSPILLCRWNDIPIPDEVIARLEKMFEFIMYYTKPDGTVPMIGDSDNGRLYRLKAWNPSKLEWVDHRYLLGIGAALFERDDFMQAAGDQWEEMVWLLGNSKFLDKTLLNRTDDQDIPRFQGQTSRLMNSGICIMRKSNTFLIINASSVGQSGRGGHAHNDFSSFELYALDQNWIVDPGTYTYTMDYCLRDSFRSTASHNVAQIDDKEINLYKEKQLFELRSDLKIQEIAWETSESVDLLRIKWMHPSYHDNYQSREITFQKDQNRILIEDILNPFKYAHMRLHFAPHVYFYEQSDSFVIVKSGNKLLKISFSPSWSVNMSDGYISIGYGYKESAIVADFYKEAGKNNNTISLRTHYEWSSIM
jgi:Heparinase II/III N-terminus/Heparinase II/III-like protein